MARDRALEVSLLKRANAILKFIEKDKERENMSRRSKAAIMPEVTQSLEREVTFVDEIKNVLNVNKIKKLVRMGAEVFSVAQPFIERPTWWNAGKAAFGVGKILVDDVELYGETFFESDEWSTPYSRDFNQTILHVLAKYPYQTLKTADEGNVIRIIDLDGTKVGWIYNIKINSVDWIYVETDRIEQGRAKIKQLLWEQFQGQPLVMRHNRSMGQSTHEQKVVFEIDDAFHPLPSAMASSYGTYLKRCLDAGVPRSVMLYGPPGTGKSTMARTLVENLDLRSFRIRVEDVSGLENSTLFEAISIFEPDAVILDDFDRAHAQAALLETLEFFQRHVKLVVSTVNNKNDLDEAILRPGRFDELIEVDRMDEAVVKFVLGEEYADGFETVKMWPIAFIQEYVKRRKFSSADEAANSTKELAKRVKRLDKYREGSDVNRMISVLSNEGDENQPPINEDHVDDYQPIHVPQDVVRNVPPIDDDLGTSFQKWTELIAGAMRKKKRTKKRKAKL